MAEQYDNNNRGAMFVNDRKTEDRHPDRSGSAKVDGVNYWISGWLKKSLAGKQFLGLAFTKKEQQSEPPVDRRNEPEKRDTPDF